MIIITNLILIVLSIVILTLLYTIFYFFASLKPSRFITPVNPSHFGLAWENIAFKTADHLTLRGWFIAQPSSRCAIIVCHGYPFDKGNVLPWAKFLHTDFNLLFFDFRSMGESEGSFTTLGFKETYDVKAALDFLQLKGFKNASILGLSMGASIALLSAQDPRIKSIVADSPFASMVEQMNESLKKLKFFGCGVKFILRKLALHILKLDFTKISPKEIVAKTLTPILLIHGDNDTYIPYQQSVQMKALRENIQFWLVPGSNHGQTHELYPEEYERRVRGFLNQNTL